jgi:ppGpp synthetase/RelA/SpoT-type nucleotidyltranferase
LLSKRLFVYLSIIRNKKTKVMANMSYCRFENTYHDLIDCFDNIFEEAENERDERHRKNMIRFLKERIDEIEDLYEELNNK